MLKVTQAQGFAHFNRISKFIWISQILGEQIMNDPLVMLYVKFPDCLHNTGDASIIRA